MTECSPDSITGALIATSEAVGIDASEPKLAMNKAQKQGYTAKTDDLFDDAFHDGSRLREGDDAIIDWIAGSRDNFDKPATSAGHLINATKSLMYQERNASQSLGEDIIQAFQPIMEKVSGEYKDNPDGRKIYTALIKDKIKELEASRPELADSPAWDKYSKWLKDGGRLYPPNPDEGLGLKGLGIKGVNNVVSNVITGNFNVFGGNIVEMMKVSTMYPDTALGTIQHAFNFTKRDDLIKAGVFNDPSKTFENWTAKDGDPQWLKGIIKANAKGTQALQDLTFLFDTPMKTWAYEAGKARGGHEEGMRAVQKITFSNRLADPTFAEMNGSNRIVTQLMHYSMGTARFYGSLWGELANHKENPKRAKQAIAGLIQYHIGMGLVAGTLNALEGKDFNEAFAIGASQVPVLYGVAEGLFSELKEMNERNKGAGTQLTKTASLNSLFIGVDIAKSVVKKTNASIEKAQEAVRNGDTETAIREGGRASIELSTVFPVITGTKAGKGVSDWLLDWWEGDFEADQAGKQLLGRTTPFYKDEVQP
jgi:hypothetical protein